MKATNQLREELFHEMNPMLDSEEMLRQMLAYVRSLFAQQQATNKSVVAKNYHIEPVAPAIEKWSGCVHVTDKEIAEDARLKAILSR